MLIFVPLAMAQQGAESRPATRIICTPPTAKVIKMVRPVFPSDAKAKDIFGKVAVEVEVDKTGKPSSVKVLKGDEILAAAVVDAVRKWRWKPLMLNGVAVEMVTTIVVSFEPR